MTASVRVEGVLRAPPEKRTGLDEEAVLLFRIERSESNWPFECRWVLGTRPEDHLRAERIANGTRGGAWVVVSAKAIYPRTDHGEAALVLASPSRIVVGQTQLL